MSSQFQENITLKLVKINFLVGNSEIKVGKPNVKVEKIKFKVVNSNFKAGNSKIKVWKL